MVLPAGIVQFSQVLGWNLQLECVMKAWYCDKVGPMGAEDGRVQTPGLEPVVKTCNGPGAA